MLRQISTLVIGILLAAENGATEAAGNNLHPDPILRCDVDERQTIYWQALGETVTLRSELFPAHGYVPSGRQSLIFADGEEIVIGEGGKYIDDADWETIDCGTYLRASNHDIIDSLIRTEPTKPNYGQPFLNMTQLNEARPDLEQCETDPNALIGGLYCDRWTSLSENFGGKNATYQQLVDHKAPILVVSYSTYGVDYVALDPVNRTIHPLFYSGC